MNKHFGGGHSMIQIYFKINIINIVISIVELQSVIWDLNYKASFEDAIRTLYMIKENREYNNIKISFDQIMIDFS